MNYLLDTHVFLWCTCNEDKLTNKVLDIIKNNSNKLFLSSASVWEIIIKSKLGKLLVPENLDEFITKQN